MNLLNNNYNLYSNNLVILSDLINHLINKYVTKLKKKMLDKI